MTLYTLTANGKAVPCTGPCLQAWPPATLPAGESKPNGSPGVSGLGVMMGAGGNLVSRNGLPLYRFVQDKDGEDAYGEGITSFGGVWHVVKTTAAPQAAEKGVDDHVDRADHLCVGVLTRRQPRRSDRLNTSGPNGTSPGAAGEPEVALRRRSLPW